MAQGDRERLRATFTEDAELYDRARPEYPRDAIDDLVELAGVGPDSRILEIGCGTAQLTVPLAELGCRIVAVELGVEMASVARRKLAPFPAVEVVTAPFEEWPLPIKPFDVVVSAAAFHWIDPAVRMRKVADALRVRGALATITNHAVGGRAVFFAEVQDCYKSLAPSAPAELRDLAAPAYSADLDSGLFSPVTLRRYEWELRYSTAQYLDLVQASAIHRTLEPAALADLLECISRVLNDRHGGYITKRHKTELRIVYRR